MIVRYEDARVLVNREALAMLTGRSPHTIRARLQPTAHDEKGRPLYVLDEAEQVLKAIPVRQRKPS